MSKHRLSGRHRVADRLGLRPEQVTPYRERDNISPDEEWRIRQELDDLESTEGRLSGNSPREFLENPEAGTARRSAVPWYRRRVRVFGVSIPVGAIIAAVLVPSVAVAALALIFHKRIDGSVKGAPVAADGGWSWVPSTDGYFMVDTAYYPQAAALATEVGGQVYTGSGANLPDNGGAVCAVQIGSNGTFTVRIVRALPGGACTIYAGLQRPAGSSGAKKVTVGDLTLTGSTDKVSVTFDPDAPALAPLFNDPTGINANPTVGAGSVLDPAESTTTYTVPLKFAIPEGADLSSAGTFAVELPLTVVSETG